MWPGIKPLRVLAGLLALIQSRCAGMAELADAADSKSEYHVQAPLKTQVLSGLHCDYSRRLCHPEQPAMCCWAQSGHSYAHCVRGVSLVTVQCRQISRHRHRHPVVAAEVAKFAFHAALLMAFARGVELGLMRQCERKAMNRAVGSRCSPRRIFFTTLERLS